MGLFGSKGKLRRAEIRRQRSDHADTLYKRLKANLRPGPLAVWIGFLAAMMVIILYGLDPMPYRPGQEMLAPVCARVPVKVPDQAATARKRETARETTPNFYVLNEGLIQRITAAVRNLYEEAQAYDSFGDYLEATPATEQQAESPAARWRLDQAAFDHLHSLSGDEGKASFSRWVDGLVEDLKHERLVRGVEEQRETPSRSSVAIFKGGLPNPSDKPYGGPESDELEVERLTQLLFITNPTVVKRQAEALARRRNTFPPSLQNLISEILAAALVEEPVFAFDHQRTREKMDLDAADPRHEITTEYRENQVLSPDPEVPRKRSDCIYYLTNEEHDLLEYEHDTFNKYLTGRMEEVPDAGMAEALRRQHYFAQVGRACVVLLLTLGLIAYCVRFEPRVITNPVRALSIATLFVLMVLASKTMWMVGFVAAYEYVVVAPVIMAAAVLTMVYSQRFALGMTAGLALLVTLSVRGDLQMMLVLAASMAVAIYQLREIRSRHELVATGILNALTGFAVAVVVYLLESHTAGWAARQGMFAAIAAFAAVAIFFLVLSPIERIFRVATNWTLLELLDTSRQLLSRLASEAPGTFAHSLWLSTLAENACEAIGANGLLAKVGAMYHDIGKVHKAEYFTENQEANINRHDKLAPTMSLLVIVGHVKDGVELAKEEGLPPAVIRFIQEHHGTTVVRFFHHVASEQQKAAGFAREVSDSEFRYPGPKPQTQETAVLMLCDGVEGAVRALPEPTAGRIETVVHSVLMDRLMDGQFDECDITLGELHKVEDSLVKSLCRFYHGRVAYPKAQA